LGHFLTLRIYPDNISTLYFEKESLRPDQLLHLINNWENVEMLEGSILNVEDPPSAC